jgi:hypothetical protein
MAKIEILGRPVSGFEIMKKYAAHHLYIVHTKDSGDQIAYRGGAEKGSYTREKKGNALRDALKVTKSSYE